MCICLSACPSSSLSLRNTPPASPEPVGQCQPRLSGAGVLKKTKFRQICEKRQFVGVSGPGGAGGGGMLWQENSPPWAPASLQRRGTLQTSPSQEDLQSELAHYKTCRHSSVGKEAQSAPGLTHRTGYSNLLFRGPSEEDATK